MAKLGNAGRTLNQLAYFEERTPFFFNHSERFKNGIASTIDRVNVKNIIE